MSNAASPGPPPRVVCAVGRLAWRPLARLPEPGGVNIYDPKMASGNLRNEMATIPPPAACDCRHY